jgi:hypothetical protein
MLSLGTQLGARTGIFLPNRECIEAKIEVTVRNGEVTFTLKELETVPGAFKSGVGEGKIAYVLGTGGPAF